MVKSKAHNAFVSITNKLATGQDLIRDANVCTFINPFSYWTLRTCPEVLDDFDVIGVDGISLCFFFRMFGIRDANRLSFDMTSVAPIVFEESERFALRVFFVGSKPSEIENAVLWIKERYPGLQVCGFHHGYFDHEGETELHTKIRNANADVVICGMGAIKQERFLGNLVQSGWRGKGYTCGGFLHQISRGGLEYYPGWIDRLNLRWAFRITNEPKLIKRYLIQYPIAFLALLQDVLSFRLASRFGGG